MADPQKSRMGVEVRIIARAWSDEAFAEELRTNPRVVIKRELAKSIPDGVNIEVAAEDLASNAWHLVIPCRPQSLTGDLAEGDPGTGSNAKETLRW